jgi:DNA polymerase-3 subunit beta
MFCIVNKEQVIDGLQKAAGIIPTRTGAAYLRSLWMKTQAQSLTIMATDASIEFTGIYPVDMKEEGLTGVNGRAFVELVRRLPQGDLRMKLDAKTGALLLEHGRRSYKLPVSDSTWFQNLAPFPETGTVLWSGDIFQEIIDKVFYCISDEEAGSAISCLYMKAREGGRVDVCGLNGHQFALTSFVEESLCAALPVEGLLIQRKYVNELRKWLGTDEIEISITDKRLFLRNSNKQEMLSLPRSNHTYPDYMAFLSRLNNPGASKLNLSRKECFEALDRLTIFNTDTDRCTYFDFNGNEAALSARGQDTGSASEYLEVEYSGDISKIAFPTRALMEILTHFDSDQLEFTLTGTEGPCGITGKDDKEYTVLIMPMKIMEQQYYAEDES